MKSLVTLLLLVSVVAQAAPATQPKVLPTQQTLSKDVLKDKIKGAWAAQVIGVTYGFPVEFKYMSTPIPDNHLLAWNDNLIAETFAATPVKYLTRRFFLNWDLELSPGKHNMTITLDNHDSDATLLLNSIATYR